MPIVASQVSCLCFAFRLPGSLCLLQYILPNFFTKLCQGFLWKCFLFKWSFNLVRTLFSFFIYLKYTWFFSDILYPSFLYPFLNVYPVPEHKNLIFEAKIFFLKIIFITVLHIISVITN